MIIMVKTPVLFITFIRTDYARQTWEGIKEARPKTLYFYSNKGRAEKEGEVECNNEIRSYINEIDWECNLHTWFRDECVNVYDSLRGAINWLFDNEECGVILEDDCVPTKAFFCFVDQMMSKFKNEKDVWYVSGDNFHNLNPSGYDYIFSRYHWMYGWATWRDRWHKINWNDFGIETMMKEDIFSKLYKTKSQASSRKIQVHKFRQFVEQTQCWDLALGTTIDKNLGFGVFPAQHLIHNIGLSGQHHKKPVETFVNIAPSYPSDTYVISNEPPLVKCDLEYDYQLYAERVKSQGIKGIIKVLRNRIFAHTIG